MAGERVEVVHAHPGPVGEHLGPVAPPGFGGRGDHDLEVLGAVRVGEHEEPVAVLRVDVVLDRVLEVRRARLDQATLGSGGVGGRKRTSLVVFESEAIRM